MALTLRVPDPPALTSQDQGMRGSGNYVLLDRLWWPLLPIEVSMTVEHSASGLVNLGLQIVGAVLNELITFETVADSIGRAMKVILTGGRRRIIILGGAGRRHDQQRRRWIMVV